MALGDLYFDVLLNDKTDQGINAIKSKLSKIGADVGASISADIQAHLNRANFSVSNVNVQAKLSIDKSALTTEIQDVLNQKFKLNVSSNIQAKDPQTLAMEAQAKLINAQARLTNAQARQADVANRAALAQARLATEQQRTAREANRAQIEATRLARQKQMLANATNRATQANRSFSNSLSSGNGGLDMLIGKAQRFAQIFAGGTILSSLIKIRGEFELQLVSLRAILQSTERANELYGQLMQLSVISPFQFGDLVKYAKQLSAFQIPANELYDTTKRLADLSAGVGVGMDRLILAYGQVRSAAVLRGTELRQFTEAGIPMVGLLADKFSELEGRVVSAGEVFDKISGKEVPFEMVKDVIEDLTSEGGMFFEMQEKQADTLKGKISNLADAYAIMMNNIGQSTDGILKGGVDAIRWSLQNYQELLNILVSIGTAYGVYRLQLAYKTRVMGEDTMATMQNALAEKQRQASMLMQESYTRQLTAQEQYLIATRTRLTMTDYKHLIATGQLNAAQVRNLFLTGKISKAQFQQLAAMAGMTKAMRMQTANLSTMGRAWERLKLSLVGVGNAFKMLGRTMMASWPMLLMGVITELIMKFSQIGEEQKRINEEIRQNAEQSLTSINNFYKSHKVTIGKLEKGDIDQDEARKLYEKIQEEILENAPTKESAISIAVTLEGEDDVVKKAEIAKKALDGLRDAKERLAHSSNFNLGEDFIGGLGDEIEELDVLLRHIKSQEGSLTNLHSDRVKNFYYNPTALGFDDEYFDESFEEAKAKIDRLVASVKTQMIGETQEAQQFIIAQGSQILKSAFSGVSAETLVNIQYYYDSILGNYDATLSYIITTLTSEQKKQLRALEGDYSGANAQMARNMVEEHARAMGLTYQQAQQLCNDISKLTASINIHLNITGAEQLTGLQMSLGAYIPSVLDANTTKKIQTYLSQAGNDYSKAVPILQKALAEAQEKGKTLILIDDEARKQKAENDALIAGITATLNNLNQPLTAQSASSKPSKSAYKSPKRSYKAQQKQVDAFTKSLEEEYKAYKDIFEKWEDLSEKMDSEEAIEFLSTMPGYDKIFDNESKREFIEKYLREGGDKDLIKYYLEKLGERATDEAKSFRKNLEGSYVSEAVKDLSEQIDAEAEALEKAMQKISDAFDKGVEELERWEEIYEKTGSEAMANSLVFGHWRQLNRKSIEELYADSLNEMTKGTEVEGFSFEALVNFEGLDELPDHIKDMVKKIQQIKREAEKELGDEVVDALVDTASITDQIVTLEAKRDKVLADFDKQANPKDYESNQRARTAIIRKYANEIGELKAKLQDLLPVWDKIFNAEDGSYKGVKDAMRTINDMLDDLTYSRSTPEGQNIFTSTFTDENGVVHTIELTSDKINELKEQYEELQDVLVDKNPFQAIYDLFTELKDQDGEIDWENIGKGVASIADLGAQAAGQLKEMFDALGMEGVAESMEWTQQALEGVSNIAKGFAEGGLIGGIASTFGVVTGFLTSIFEKHDAELQKQIEESQRVVKKLQQEREAIERAIDRGLGGAYGGRGDGRAYIEMLQKLRAERAELEEQYQAEQDKKDTDKDALIDLEGEMASLDDQIRYLAEDTLAELMEIDLKGWASQIGDALVDAFANGEDAVAAFDQSVGEMIKSVVKNMASLYIIEPMMEDLRRYLFGEDGRGGVFGSDYYLDADELAGMKEYLDVIREKGIPAVKELYEGVDAATGGIMSAGTMEGLSAGIKSVTEDTANLLASYLNAVRADVALIASGNPRMTTIAEAQLVQLNAIALNTSRNALAAESINELLRSVTTTTPQGRVLKV